MSTRTYGGSAFPVIADNGLGHISDGMTMRDYYAGQAVANQVICTGSAPDYDLTRWFGGRGGITRAEIVAAQAFDYADAMLKERSK